MLKKINITWPPQGNDWSRSLNGGNYAYYEEAIINPDRVIVVGGVIEDGIVTGHHSTSAELDYCPNCGRFGECDCDSYHPSPLMDDVIIAVAHGQKVVLREGEDACIAISDAEQSEPMRVFLEGLVETPLPGD